MLFGYNKHLVLFQFVVYNGILFSQLFIQMMSHDIILIHGPDLHLTLPSTNI